MLDDGDTVLNLVGAGIVLAVILGLVIVGLNFAPQSGDGAPGTDWAFERLNGSHVAVTHAGGEPVSNENLRVTVDSVRRATDWGETVTEGDRTVVPASEGSLVRIVWNGGRGDRQIMAGERV